MGRKKKYTMTVNRYPHGCLWWLIFGWWWRPIAIFFEFFFAHLAGYKRIKYVKWEKNRK